MSSATKVLELLPPWAQQQARLQRLQAQAQANQAAAIHKPSRFKFRGENANIQKFITEPRPAEFLLEGAAETGKTIASLNLLDQLARAYKNARMVIVRQFHVDLMSTVLDIWKREFVDPAGDIRIFGGESPVFYEYPNNTRIWVAGMDRPGKVLSGALDVVYVNQAEEIKQDGWETLSTRTTGRAGAMTPGILFGDMNPAPKTHWIYAREAAGKLPVYFTTHKDNPRLFDDSGNPTEYGNATITRLSNLTGVLRARLFEGQRASVAGLVYDGVWDERDGSVTEDAEYVPNGGIVFWAADDGYSAGSAPQSGGRDPHTGYYVADSHPRVFLLCQLKADGHLDIFDESYACVRLTDEHIVEVLAKPYPKPDIVAHGPGAAEFRGRLMAAGLLPNQCTAQVEPSIAELRSWLAKDKNGWRRIRVHPRCKQLRGEMTSYVYDPVAQKPVKQFDHGPDAIRGLVWVLRLRR